MPEIPNKEQASTVSWEMPTSIKEREQKLKDDLTEDDMLYLASK